MNTVGERIKQLRGSYPQRWLSDKLSIPQTTLSNYENNRSELSFAMIEALVRTFSVNTDWLLFGVGPMRSEEGFRVLVDPTQPQNTPDLVWIPMVEAVLATGCASLEISDQGERMYAFNYDFIIKKGNPKNMVLMRVSGDSMEPEVFSNDVVLIDQSKRNILPGRIFAVAFEKSIYLKRIDNIPGKIILKSANPAYPPVELDVRNQKEEGYKIIGRVLWCAREYC